ncbi:hypothetical protein CUR178_06019 [Leishmania enriettii]|uniref:Uncharacterized protein n=1 Tax=Leishmania enriettii TaxID=5663 RepID=A0A836HDK0_LEIEN|nr:hypothetical protein CUR178_06019 [Leishmania enriettii]
MQPLSSDALTSPSPHPLLTRIEEAEQLSTRPWSASGSTLQDFLQLDIGTATGTTSSGGLGGGAGVSGGGGGVREVFTPSSFSGLSSLASPSVPGAGEGGGGQVTPTEGFTPSHSAARVLEASLSNHQPQKCCGRQWTRRREPLRTTAPAGGDGSAVRSAVTNVRDLVRSAGCSPSKEPRSASVSRRDRLASSLASALVPRDEQSESSRPRDASAGDDDDELERCAEPGARAVTAGSRSSGGDGGVYRGTLPVQRLEEPEVACAPTSPRRTPSWRQLQSHPATTTTTASASDSSAYISHGSTNSAAAPARGGAYALSVDIGSWPSIGASSLLGGSRPSTATECSTAATLLGEGEPNRRGGDCGDESYSERPSWSGVSSPSLITPLPSPRTAAPIVSAMKVGTAMLSSSPALTARELAQMEELRGIAEAQRRDSLTTTTPSFLPPLLQRPASEGLGSGGGGPASWRSESLSRASFSTSLANVTWNGRGSTAQTPLNWERGGLAGETGGACGSSCSSPACWSTSELDLGGYHARPEWRDGGRCSRISSPMSGSLGGVNGPTGVRHGMPLRSPLTSLTTSPSFAHLTLRLCQGCGSDGDDSTMEEIEVMDAKRKCVESPRASPTAISLSATSRSSSFTLSLADALAAEPARAAMSSEAGLWQQQQHRRRTVSPSVARPEEGPVCCDGADVYASTHHRDRSTFSPTSPIRTTAPSMVPVHPPPLLGTPLSSSLLATGVRGQPREMGSDCTPATFVDGAAAVLKATETNTGVVVEVDDQLASSLSSGGSGGSDDEPEVDTFSLERAQAVMEDADAEAASALRARQHRLYLLATSQFAQDVERHGGHVDPVQLELEGEEGAAKGDEQEWGWKGCGCRPSKPGVCRGASYAISAEPQEGGATRLRWNDYDSSPLQQDGRGAKKEGEVSSSPAATCTSPYCALQAPPPFSAVPRNIPSANTVEHCQVSEEESSVTPLRRSACTLATAARVRWSEPEESEDGRSPGSVETTAGSRSRRDVSPPIRERSMAPAELRKEREGRYQFEDGGDAG